MQRHYDAVTDALLQVSGFEQERNDERFSQEIENVYDRLLLPRYFDDMHDFTHIKDIAKGFGFSYKSNRQASIVLRAFLEKSQDLGYINKNSANSSYQLNTGPRLPRHAYGLQLVESAQDSDGEYVFIDPQWSDESEQPYPVVRIGAKSEALAQLISEHNNVFFAARIHYDGNGEYVAYVDQAYNHEHGEIDINQYIEKKARETLSAKVIKKAALIRKRQLEKPDYNDDNPYGADDLLPILQKMTARFIFALSLLLWD